MPDPKGKSGQPYCDHVKQGQLYCDVSDVYSVPNAKDKSGQTVMS